MTGLAKSLFPTKPISLALMALAFSGFAASAATIVVKNDSPASVQIGFDGTAAMTVAPRGRESFTLPAGEHTAQCRFAGGYDGCNMEERFTLTDRGMTLSLQPVFTLPHAITLAQQTTLAIETRREGVWATTTLDVAGMIDDCANYETGKLGTVSQRVSGRMILRSVTLTTQTLCGEQRPAIGAMVGGTQLYFPLRFLAFRDGGGHLIMVRQ